MASAVIETRILKLAGVSEPIFTANSAPPSEPIAPPIANASSLNRVVLIAHRVGDLLVLPHRVPGPPDPGRRQRHDTNIASKHERQRQVVEVLRIVLEVEAGDLGVGDAAHPVRPAEQRLGPLRAEITPTISPSPSVTIAR